MGFAMCAHGSAFGRAQRTPRTGTQRHCAACPSGYGMGRTFRRCRASAFRAWRRRFKSFGLTRLAQSFFSAPRTGSTIGRQFLWRMWVRGLACGAGCVLGFGLGPHGRGVGPIDDQGFAKMMHYRARQGLAYGVQHGNACVSIVSRNTNLDKLVRIQIKIDFFKHRFG